MRAKMRIDYALDDRLPNTIKHALEQEESPDFAHPERLKLPQ